MSESAVAVVTLPASSASTALAEAADLCGRSSVEWVRATATAAGLEVLVEGQDAAARLELASVLSARGGLALVVPAEAPLLPSGLLTELVRAGGESGAARAVLGRPDVPVDAGVVGLSASRLATSLREAPDTPVREVAASLFDDVDARVATVASEDGDEAGLLVTGPVALTRARAALTRRLVDALVLAGVDVRAPGRLVVDASARIEAGVVLHADVAVLGDSRVGSGSVLHQGVWLNDSRLAQNVTVLPYSVLEGAQVGEGSSVGPFARLRPETVLAAEVKVGNFVEVKKATLGRGSKASHLTYLGDAELGERVNIGAGTITCNYDGVDKHRTTIGNDVFVGSDTMLVAPVELGDGAATGAGSTITRDVPANALAVGRARQRNLEGRAGKKK